MSKRPAFNRRSSPKGKTTDWSGVAGWYDKLVGEEGSEYQRQVVLPGAMRLLGLNPGDACVDVACGQGVLCRQLADRGVKMTGIDAAPPLIAAARSRQKADADNAGGAPPSIDYRVGDARDLSFLPPATFDAAACLLAIQNINPIGPVFSGVAAALKPWGKFVLVMMHPCFRGLKETAWGWDDKTGVQYRRVDRYLLPRKSPIVAHPGKDPDTYTWSFHKPIEAYARALRGAGLLIDAMEEWPSHKTSDSGPRAAAENSARKEIPMFLAIRALKASVEGA
jgi:ubiquinone/menaquinone biosynthesis C-methylase UbiE